MQIGDICNLGIACLAPTSNRHVLDFITETLDPQGCAHIAYADDNTVNKLRVANQTSGYLPKGSGGRVCHESDGDGTFCGTAGRGDFHFDSDGCLDGDQGSVKSQNRGDGKDFSPAESKTISLDSLGTALTIQGVGTSGGLPVAFVMIATASTPTSPGSVSVTFSDGFSNAGPLSSGAIAL